MKKLSILILITTLSIFNVVNAQKKKVKFGKVKIQDLKEKVCPIDSNAHAERLYDKGYTYFDFTADGAKLVTTKHTRIKIYDKEGYRHADVKIPCYVSNMKGEEKIGSIKAYTYNLENGKIIKSQIKRDGIFSEKLTKNIKIKKFTFPDIKEGCIIEYRYTKTSDFFFNLESWYFQHDIPVRYTTYTARIPEIVDYKRTVKGYERIKFNTESSSEGDMYVKDYVYTGVNIKPFPDEKFIFCKEDYISKLEFELTAIKKSGIWERFNNNWKNIHKELMQNMAFGIALKRDGYCKKILPGIIADCKTQDEKIQRIYNFIKKHIKWNKKYSMYAGRPFKKIHASKSGSSGEINLFLTALFRAAGIECNPVILSTRSHGKIRFGAPKISQYNHCISGITVNGQVLLVDATDRLIPMDLLPFNDFNREGVMIKPNGTVKIPLENKTLSNHFITINASFNEDGQLEGQVTSKYSKYEAFLFRKSFSNIDQRVKKLEKDMEDFSIENYKIQNIKNPNKEAGETYNFTLGEEDELPSTIYLPPLLNYTQSKNPFKLEERRFPVELPYPQMDYIVINIEIPEGYEASDLPKNISAVMPNNSCSFAFQYNVANNKLTITYQMRTIKTLFLPEEYVALKNFYNMLIKKHSEKIVIKRKV